MLALSVAVPLAIVGAQPAAAVDPPPTATSAACTAPLGPWSKAAVKRVLANAYDGTLSGDGGQVASTDSAVQQLFVQSTGGGSREQISVGAGGVKPVASSRGMSEGAAIAPAAPQSVAFSSFSNAFSGGDLNDGHSFSSYNNERAFTPYGTISQYGATNSLTLEMFFRVANGSTGPLLGIADTQAPNIPNVWVPLIYVGGSGKLQGAMYPAPLMTSANRVDDDQWHHVALRWDNAAKLQTLLVDGVPSGTSTTTPAWIVNGHEMGVTSLGHAYMAGWPDPPQYSGGWGGYRYWPGSMDEVALYQSALPDARVAAHLAARAVAPTATGGYAFSVKADKPQRYWRLADPAGTFLGSEETGAGPSPGPLYWYEDNPNTGQTYLGTSSAPSDGALAGDTNHGEDVFVRNRTDDTTERVSVTTGGNERPTLFGSYGPTPNADASVVDFVTDAALVANDTNTSFDVYQRDRVNGTTTLLSGLGGSPAGAGGGSSSSVSTTADGRYTVFLSSAAGLATTPVAASPAPLAMQVWLHDNTNNLTYPISTNSAGGLANGASSAPHISSDGAYVTYSSYANDLVGGDTNAQPDVFVYSLQYGLTKRISLTSTGAQASNPSSSPTISRDGRSAVFQSDADLVPGDTNGVSDVYAFDLQTSALDLVSHRADGTAGNGASTMGLGLTGSGQAAYGSAASFVSNATDLDGTDPNGSTRDTYVATRQVQLTNTDGTPVAAGSTDVASYTTQFTSYWQSALGATPDAMAAALKGWSVRGWAPAPPKPVIGASLSYPSQLYLACQLANILPRTSSVGEIRRIVFNVPLLGPAATQPGRTAADTISAAPSDSDIATALGVDPSLLSPVQTPVDNVVQEALDATVGSPPQDPPAATPDENVQHAPADCSKETPPAGETVRSDGTTLRRRTFWEQTRNLSTCAVSARSFAAPAFRPLPDGTWAPIRPALTASSDSTDAAVGSEALRPVHLPSTAAGSVKVDLDGGPLTLTPTSGLDNSTVAGTSDGASTVNYPVASSTGTSLSYRLSNSGVTLSATLSPDSARTLKFHITGPPALGALAPAGEGWAWPAHVDDARLGLTRPLAVTVAPQPPAALPGQQAALADIRPGHDQDSADIAVAATSDGGHDVTLSVNPAWEKAADAAAAGLLPPAGASAIPAVLPVRIEWSLQFDAEDAPTRRHTDGQAGTGSRGSARNCTGGAVGTVCSVGDHEQATAWVGHADPATQAVGLKHRLQTDLSFIDPDAQVLGGSVVYNVLGCASAASAPQDCLSSTPVSWSLGRSAPWDRGTQYHDQASTPLTSMTVNGGTRGPVAFAGDAVRNDVQQWVGDNDPWTPHGSDQDLANYPNASYPDRTLPNTGFLDEITLPAGPSSPTTSTAEYALAPALQLTAAENPYATTSGATSTAPPTTPSVLATTPPAGAQQAQAEQAQPQAAAPSSSAASQGNAPETDASYYELPGQVPNVRATVVGQKATVTWDAPRFTGWPKVNKYVLAMWDLTPDPVSGQPGKPKVVLHKAVGGGEQSTTFEGLEGGVDHFFQVWAVNAAGDGKHSAPSNLITSWAPLQATRTSPGDVAGGAAVPVALTIANPNRRPVSVEPVDDTTSSFTVATGSLNCPPDAVLGAAPSCTVDNPARGALGQATAATVHVGGFVLKPTSRQNQATPGQETRGAPALSRLTASWRAVGLTDPRRCSRPPGGLAVKQHGDPTHYDNDNPSDPATTTTTLNPPPSVTPVAWKMSACDGGLGAPDWQGRLSQPAPAGHSLTVDTTSGDLSLAAQDAPPVPGDAGLSLGVTRRYDSGELGSSPLGLAAGWHLDLGSGSIIPTDGETGAQPAQPTVMVSAEGTRAVLWPRTVARFAPPATGTSGLLAPRALTLRNGETACIDTAYAQPAGLALRAWRYVAVPSGCTSTATGRLLGWGSLTTDRHRVEYRADGFPVDIQTGTGTELRNDTDGKTIKQSEIDTACPGVGADGCRTITITGLDTSKATAVDAAGRLSTWQFSGSGPGRTLTSTIRPDGTTVSYGYGGCGGTTAQLCTITDGLTYSTRVRYGSTVPFAEKDYFGPPAVVGVTDIRGENTALTYSFKTSAVQATSTDSSGRTATRIRRWTGIDAAGRPAGTTVERAQGNGGVAETAQTLTWSGCSPSAVVHTLCSRTDVGTGLPGAARDQVTSYRYGPERELLARGTGSSTTTYGWAVTTTGASTWSRVYDRVSGSSGVAVEDRRADVTGAPLAAAVDAYQQLTPAGNNVGTSSTAWTPFLTDYSLDTTDDKPGFVHNATPCTGNTSTGVRCSMTQPTGDQGRRTWTSTYDSSGRPVTVKAPRGGVSSTGYVPSGSARGWVATSRDATGIGADYGYDSQGDVTTRTDTAGKTWSYDYDKQDRRTAATDPLSARSLYAYDAEGRQVQARSPRGTAANASAAFGPGSSQTDTRTAFDTFTGYEPGGQVTDVWEPAGDADGSSLAQRPHTLTTYDRLGRATSTTNPANQVLGYSWTPAGRLANRTTNRDCLDSSHVCRTSWAYTGPGQVWQQTTAAVADGRPSIERAVWNWTYDDQGRRTRQVQHDGRKKPDGTTFTVPMVTTWGYDADGNQTSVAHQPQQPTTTGYNPDDTVQQVFSPTSGGLGVTTTTGYDTDGNRALVTAPDGAQQQYNHDNAGRTTVRYDQRKPGDANSFVSTGYAYDTVGRPTVTSHGINGNAARDGQDLTTYDADGRVADQVLGATLTATGADAQTASAAGHDLRTRSVYDLDGNRTASYPSGAFSASGSTADPAWATNYTVDKRGLTTTVSTPRGPLDAAASPGCRQDSAGWRCDTTTSYDTAGRPTRVSSAGSELVTSRTWTVDGLVTKETLPSPASDSTSSATDTATTITTTDYDAYGRSRMAFTYSDTNNALQAVRTVRSGSGLLLEQSDKVNGGQPDATSSVQRRDYDGAGQLQWTDGPGKLHTDFTAYSDRGLLLKSVVRPAGTTPDKTTSQDLTTSYGYDNDGRLIEQDTPPDATSSTVGKHKWSWTGDGLLASDSTLISGSGTSESYRSTAYGYDAAGRQASATSIGPVSYAADNPNSSTATGYTAAGLPSYRSQTAGYTANNAAVTTTSLRTDWSYGPDGRPIAIGATTAPAVQGLPSFSSVGMSWWYDGLLRHGGPSDGINGLVYDSAGRLTGEQTATQSTAYSRNRSGAVYRVNSTLIAADGGTSARTWDRTYDSLGRITGDLLTARPGDSNSPQQKEELTWGSSPGADSVVVSSREPGSKAADWHTQQVWTQAYSPQGWLTRTEDKSPDDPSADGSTSSARSRVYDHDSDPYGRLAGITRSDNARPAPYASFGNPNGGPQQTTTTYGYDAASNRTSAATNFGTSGNTPPVDSLVSEAFAYNQAGQPTVRTTVLKGSQDRQVHSTNQYFAYNGLGQTTRDGCTVSAYDAGGRLFASAGTSVTGNAANPEVCPKDAQKAATTYYANDALGRQTTSTGSDGVTSYAHLTSQLELSGSTGSDTKRAAYSHDDQGHPLFLTSSKGRTEALWRDGVGNIGLDLDGVTGSTLCQASFDAWGKPVDITGNDNSLEGVRFCRSSGQTTENRAWHDGAPVTSGTGAIGSYKPVTLAGTANTASLDTTGWGIAATLHTSSPDAYGPKGASLPSAYTYIHQKTAEEKVEAFFGDALNAVAEPLAEAGGCAAGVAVSAPETFGFGAPAGCIGGAALVGAGIHGSEAYQQCHCLGGTISGAAIGGVTAGLSAGIPIAGGALLSTARAGITRSIERELLTTAADDVGANQIGQLTRTAAENSAQRAVGSGVQHAASTPGSEILALPRAGRAAEAGGAVSVRLGQAGETAVRGAYDIGPKATAEIGGRTRIFDGLNGEAVSEVKNVGYQAYTQQLKDSLAYATDNGLYFDLYVRSGGGTRLSGPLADAIAGNPLFRLKYIP